MPPRVLLTRPAALAHELAARVLSLGFEPVIEPLLIFEPLDRSCPDVLPEASLIVTSRLALEALRGRELAALKERPCFVVGARSAAAARTLGFRDVREGPGDGDGLAAWVGQVLGPGASVLHLAGQDVAPTFHDALRRQGLRVDVWTLYRAQAVEALSEAAREALAAGRIDAALFFSARTAQTFRAAVTRAGLGACCARVRAIGLSEAALAPVADMGWRAAVSAAAPTEEAVLAALTDLFHLDPRGNL